jgi:hypothetical protein
MGHRGTIRSSDSLVGAYKCIPRNNVLSKKSFFETIGPLKELSLNYLLSRYCPIKGLELKISLYVNANKIL